MKGVRVPFGCLLALLLSLAPAGLKAAEATVKMAII